MKMHKYGNISRFVSGIICIAMIFALLSDYPTLVTAEGTEPGWSGYTPVSTPEELDAVRENLSGKYYLTNDIAFTEDDFAEGGALYNNGQGWKPIGADGNSAFTGVFDGNGYSVIGLESSRSSDTNVGIFGYNKGIISNLGIKDSAILTKASSGYAGGIAGYNDGTIEKCFNVNTTVSVPYDGGGIAGHCGTKSVVADCYNTGTVHFTSSGSSGSVGGIIGYNQGGSITNCYSVGAITGNCSNVHGISNGTTSGGTACYYLDTVFGGLTSDKMREQETYVGFDFVNTWMMDGYPILQVEKREPYVPVTVLNLPETLELKAGETDRLIPDFGDTNPSNKRLTWKSSNEFVATVNSNGVVTGCSEGSAVITATAARGEKSASCTVTVTKPEDAIAISTAEELNMIGYEYPLDGYYYLTDDIDLTDLTAPGGAYYNNGLGWEPIGNSDTPFTGVFDGQNHHIIGMIMNRPAEDNVGLFGYTDNALIKSVVLENCAVTGKNDVGGLIGKGIATPVYGCKFEGGMVSGSSNIGGLIGEMVDNVTISNCKNKGIINSQCASGNVGGIGGLVPSGIIKNCINVGVVKGTFSNVYY